MTHSNQTATPLTPITPGAPLQETSARTVTAQAPVTFTLSGDGSLSERIAARYLVIQTSQWARAHPGVTVAGPLDAELEAALIPLLEALKVARGDEATADAHEQLRRLLIRHGHTLPRDHIVDWSWVRLDAQNDPAPSLTSVLSQRALKDVSPLPHVSKLAGLRGAIITPGDPETHGVTIVVAGAVDDGVRAPQVILRYPDGITGGELTIYRYPGGDIGMAISGVDLLKPSMVTTMDIISNGRCDRNEIELNPFVLGFAQTPRLALAELGWLTADLEPGRPARYRLSAAGLQLPRTDI